MKPKSRGASEQPKRHQSFIRLRPDPPDTIPGRMRSPVSGGQLRDDQIDRAQHVVQRLKALFPPERGSLTRLEEASRAAGHLLKQQTMSAVLNNRQCGYSVAQRIMEYAKSRDELADVPSNYILGNAEGGAGTEPARRYALHPMRYPAKGHFLDAIASALPGEFLDFTARRDPIEPEAATWNQLDWYSHVAKELEVWKDQKARKLRR